MHHSPRTEGISLPCIHQLMGRLGVLTRNARARLSTVPSPDNSSIQPPGCFPCSSPLPAAMCTHTAMPHTEQGHDFTHLGRRKLGKLLDESSLFFPICPLGEEVKFSNRLPCYLGQSMPELSDEHYRREGGRENVLSSHLRPAKY